MQNYNIVIEEDNFPLQSADLAKLDMIAEGQNKYHAIRGNTSFQIEILEKDLQKKAMTLRVNGNTYSLKIEDEYDLLVKELGFSFGSAQKFKNITAPMPGLILDILVSPGQEIKQGDQLMILEAMKMENILKAQGDGIIKSIETAQGDAVEKGQTLIEIE